MIARRADDFASTGIYLVDTKAGTKRMYRDPESKYWIEEDYPRFWTKCVLGYSKAEALAELAKLYGEPARRRTTVAKAADIGVDVGARWVTTCELHGTMVGSASKKLAQAAADYPDFCDQCQEGLS